MCSILQVTCEVLWKVLMPQYLKAPSSAAEWEGVSHEFEQLWNFPHCIGKHYFLFLFLQSFVVIFLIIKYCINFDKKHCSSC